MLSADPSSRLESLPTRIRESDYLRPAYRPNVAAIVRDPDDRILWCERADFPGTWQFPQGGIDPEDASAEDALWRELEEELGVHDPRAAMHIETALETPIAYAYPLEVLESWIENERRTWLGQAQHYFLLRFTGDDSRITLEPPEGIRREFCRFVWDSPARIRDTPGFKRSALERALRRLDLF